MAVKEYYIRKKGAKDNPPKPVRIVDVHVDDPQDDDAIVTFHSFNKPAPIQILALAEDEEVYKEVVIPNAGK